MTDDRMTLSISPLPGPTWNWLKVNDAEIKVPEEAEEALTEVNLPGELSDTMLLDEEDVETLISAESGLGSNFAAWIAGCPVDPVTITASKGMQAETPAVVRLYATNKEAAANRYQVIARQDSELTLVMYISGKDVDAASDGNATVSLDTRILIQDGAKVHLVQVCDGGAAVGSYVDVAAVLGERSELSILQISMGEAEAFFGVAADLQGKSSKLSIDTAFSAGAGERVDMNYIARHHGKHTESVIRVNGVLRENAEKTFRGTIDFIRGSAGATGDEREDVLLLGENVVNKTVPLILCSEEDVEGSHGATIGDLSDETLYYFRSRGIDDETAYNLIAAGRLVSAVQKIPDETLKNELLVKMGELEEEDSE